MLATFPGLAEQLIANPDHELWEGSLIERASCAAVGQLGSKGPPDESGVVEIGYGVSPAFQGRGYATEMVGALTPGLLERPNVKQVTAECLETNVASARVLQKTGFKLADEKFGDEGLLLVWAHN